MNQTELNSFVKRARQRLVDSIKGFGEVKIQVYDTSNEVWYYAVNLKDESVDVVMPEDIEIYQSGDYKESDFIVTSYYYDELTFNELYDIAQGVAILKEE